MTLGMVITQQADMQMPFCAALMMQYHTASAGSKGFNHQAHNLSMLLSLCCPLLADCGAGHSYSYTFQPTIWPDV